MAKAGRITIAEVEHLVEPGELDPDNIHVASVYVHRIFEGKNYEKRIERKTVRLAGKAEWIRIKKYFLEVNPKAELLTHINHGTR